MGKNKPSTISCLKYLIEKEIQVAAVVAPMKKSNDLEEHLQDVANQFKIPIITDDEIYTMLSKKTEDISLLHDLDLVISFLFWKKIKKPIIELSKIGTINFHPAPLPDFRGVNGYSFAIYENSPIWGVSAHFVDESFDTGDIIKVNKFPIDPKKETAFSLEQKSQTFLVSLFKEVINLVKENKNLPRTPQRGGRYYSMNDFEKLRVITKSDSLEEIERKIRAFWYPPYKGACVKIHDSEFTVINQRILNDISSRNLSQN